MNHRLMNQSWLESQFDKTIATECTEVERLYMETHPKLRLYALLWFVRGCDAANSRYREVIDSLLSSGGSVKELFQQSGG